MKYLYDMHRADGERYDTHTRLWVEDALALIRTGGYVSVSNLNRATLFILRSKAQLDEFCKRERDQLWSRELRGQIPEHATVSFELENEAVSTGVSWDDCLWFGDKMGYLEGEERARATRMLAALVGLAS